MITTIRFNNFKALENFSITLKEFNILTGPNNSGKSTIIDGLRLLQRAYRYASRNNPKTINNPFGKMEWGHEIPRGSLDINLGTLQTNFNETEPSIVKFSLTGRKTLTLIFHPDHPSYLFFSTPNKVPKTANEYRKEFPINI